MWAGVGEGEAHVVLDGHTDRKTTLRTKSIEGKIILELTLKKGLTWILLAQDSDW